MRKIKKGDFVNVVFTNSDVSPFNTTRVHNCVVDNTPSDAGDQYYFTAQDGTVFTVNPNCSAFLGLVLQLLPY